MPFQVVAAKLDTSSSDHVVLMIDASELDQEKQNKTIQFIKALLYNVPTNMQKSIYFLGNSYRYSDYLFDTQASIWFDQNKYRASLISPIIKQLDLSDQSKIILIGSNTVFDIDDWKDLHVPENIIQICFDSPESGEASISHRLFSPSLDDLSLYINNPIKSVRINGEGWVPIRWSNSGYQLEIIDKKFSLIANDLENYLVELVALIYRPDSLISTIIYSNGKHIVQPLVGKSSPDTIQNDLLPLTKVEAAAFHNARSNNEFICPVCKDKHKWDQIFCYDGNSLIGKFVYPSISSVDRRVVVFYSKGNAVFFDNNIYNVFLIDLNTVVVLSETKAQLYHLNMDTREWDPSQDSIHNYMEVERGKYLLFL